MDTDLLRTFLSVASIGSFTLAAKKLQLTQPALSKRIKRLEAIVGTNLFDRVGNHVIETEAGRLLRQQHPLFSVVLTTRFRKSGTLLVKSVVSCTLEPATI